jgi:hypothetical protein
VNGNESILHKRRYILDGREEKSKRRFANLFTEDKKITMR